MKSGTMLRIDACLRDSTSWADKGYSVAADQFELVPYDYPAISRSVSLPSFIRDNDGMSIVAGDTRLKIDSTGALSSWIKNSVELLVAPLQPYFWKPVNDNQDVNSYYRENMSVWRNVASRREIKNLEADIVDGCVRIVARMRLPVGADYTLTYTVNGDGRIRVDADYVPEVGADIPYIPKFGMKMCLSADMDSVEYYGRGPQENYPDRKLGYFVGNYSMPLSLYQHDYIRPQDNGNRCDVRWLTLSSASQTLPIVRIEGCGTPLCIRAWDYGEDDLESARHPYELKRGQLVNVNIDSAVHGVGGINTWGAPTLEPYVIRGDKPHSYSFILSAMDQR